MKTAFLVLSLLGTTLAFGQQPAGPVGGRSHSYQAPSHPAHATAQALATERYLLGTTNYYSVRGHMRTWDLPQAPTPTRSLGESARILREEHAKLTKARVVFEN
jgi:hypothetical protein